MLLKFSWWSCFYFKIFCATRWLMTSWEYNVNLGLSVCSWWTSTSCKVPCPPISFPMIPIIIYTFSFHSTACSHVICSLLLISFLVLIFTWHKAFSDAPQGLCFFTLYKLCSSALPFSILYNFYLQIKMIPKPFPGAASGPQCFPMWFFPHIQPQKGCVGGTAIWLHVDSIVLYVLCYLSHAHSVFYMLCASLVVLFSSLSVCFVIWHMSVDFHGNRPYDLCSLFILCVYLVVFCVHMCIHVRLSFPKGERLRIPANKCCPECISSSQGSCQYEGVIYGVSEKDSGSFFPHHLILQPFYQTLICTHKIDLKETYQAFFSFFLSFSVYTWVMHVNILKYKTQHQQKLLYPTEYAGAAMTRQ